MVDLFSLALTHGLMAVALWRLLQRPELDVEDAPAPRRSWTDARRRAEADGDA